MLRIRWEFVGMFVLGCMWECSTYSVDDIEYVISAYPWKHIVDESLNTTINSDTEQADRDSPS